MSNNRIELTFDEKGAYSLYKMSRQSKIAWFDYEGVYTKEEVEHFKAAFPLSETEYDEEMQMFSYIPTPLQSTMADGEFDLLDFIEYIFKETLPPVTHQHVAFNKLDEGVIQVVYTSRKKDAPLSHILSKWVISYTINVLTDTVALCDINSTIVYVPMRDKKGSVGQVIRAVRDNIAANAKLLKVSKE